MLGFLHNQYSNYHNLSNGINSSALCESLGLMLLANLCARNVRIICTKPYNIMEHNTMEQHNNEPSQH